MKVYTTLLSPLMALLALLALLIGTVLSQSMIRYQELYSEAAQKLNLPPPAGPVLMLSEEANNDVVNLRALFHHQHVEEPDELYRRIRENLRLAMSNALHPDRLPSQRRKALVAQYNLMERFRVSVKHHPETHAKILQFAGHGWDLNDANSVFTHIDSYLTLIKFSGDISRID
ncbi:hypothetical protein BCV70DRAFT_231815 [Testicularia cyperi]|uniref:Uncharacterized protein n=1 Tax=Testicularia cyperi TaxID=1882483 RepID=A0A317XQW2_9BASI|nr:hypothetical protein BCV70DRAFT_231815 [Testicularia cyperi]